jgi:RNA polymerase primary sigma factor
VRQLKISADKLTRRSDNTSRYFNEVDRRPILSAEEEFKIAMRAKDGDARALEKLVTSNLRFVISVAKQYSGSGAALDDLICQGNIGLCDAAKTFDPTRGFKFISYAVWHIRKEILQYLNNQNKLVRTPTNVLNDLSKIKKADEVILQREGRSGTIEELEEVISQQGKEVASYKIKSALEVDLMAIPLEPTGPDDLFSPIEWLGGEFNTTQLTDEWDRIEIIKIILEKLQPIEQKILTLKLGLDGSEPESFKTIGEKMDKSTEWARNIYLRSIRKLKVKLRKSKEELVLAN